MRFTRRQWMVALFAALANAPAGRRALAEAAATSLRPRLTPDQIREDLAYLRMDWAPLDQSFNAEQRIAFEQAIAAAANNAESISAEDFVLDVMRAVAIPRNGHTAALVGSWLSDLPIRMWWFSDGLYVVKTQPEFSDLLGARIEKLGLLTPDEALARVAPYISGTDQRILCLSPAYLGSPMVLHRIGAAPDVTEVSLTLRSRSGSVRVVTLGVASAPDPGDLHNPVQSSWSVLIPDARETAGRWVHVLDNVAERSPTYATPTILSTRWLGDGERVLYIRSNYIRSDGGRRLDEGLLFGIVQGILVPRQPPYVVVDLRMNNGGNFFETLLFAQGLPRLMPANGHIFVLVSRATFSAALVTAAVLKGSSQHNVTLIGEPMGDGGHFWGEIGTKILPNSRITVTYGTRFEDYEHGCTDPRQCYWPTVAFGPRDISIAPDVSVDVSFADYASGRDPVLARALSMTG